jgi:uncharacterized protein DUF4124
MATTRMLIIAAALLACAPALAQTDANQAAPTRNRAVVYKCINADGTVIFSESPCSTDPKKVKEVDTSSALLTGSGGHQRDIAAGVADSDCRARARQSAYGTMASDMQASNNHIADYEQRQAQLAEQRVYAPDGSGNLIPDPYAAAAIADLNASIRQERDFQRKATANADLAFQNAAKGCDEQAAALEAAKKTSPAPQDSGKQ